MDSAPPGGGFTLVELLVVIAIIALLLAVMAPSAMGLFRLSRTTICKSNLHMIGQAAATYAADNNLYVPRDGHPSQTGHYLFAGCFMRYTHNVEVPISKLQDWTYLYNAFRGAAPTYRCPSIQDPQCVLTYPINAVDHDEYPRSGQYKSDEKYARPIQLHHLPTGAGEVVYIIEMSRKISVVPYNNFTYYDVWDSRTCRSWARRRR